MFDIAQLCFQLPETFLKPYKNKQPDWGPLGYFTYKRTYARQIPEEGRTEEYWETCRRVVNGSFSIQENHCKRNHLPWDERKAQRTAKRMFELMWGFRFLPPGRGMWAMGTNMVEQKGSAALNNCAYVSTANIENELSKPFRFVMDMSMLGVGCGFGTEGAGTMIIPERPPVLDGGITIVIEDTREAWVDALGQMIDSCLKGLPVPSFNYNRIRSAGEPIKTFGGTASGPAPLKELLDDINLLFIANAGKEITSTIIVDIMNMIGRCVVAGNVRRSAEIALGDADDHDFALLKQDKEKLNAYRWCSNNSIRADIGMDYSWHASLTATNGEPGFFWPKNAQAYGRMKDPMDWTDREAVGTNPCQPAWATVLTLKGIQTIADINVSDLIWSGKEWTTVINKWPTGIKNVYRYHTRAGSFNGTENHRIVSHGDKIEVDQAESIDTSQCVIECDGSDVEFTQTIVDGLVLGDGTVHKASNNLVLLCIGQDDQDYFEDNLAGFLDEHRSGIHKGHYEIKTKIQHWELPHTYDRIIPDRYFYATPQIVASFLRGLYTANGSVVDKRVTLKASSHKLICQVQEMLSSLGIRSYYTTNKQTVVEFENRESYDLNISTDRDKFYNMIGFVQKYKMDKLRSVIDNINTSKYACSRPKTSYEIISKELLSQEEVFDLTVDDPDHTYWTGGLLVSNCSEQTLHNYELCTLVETFPARHENLDEYLETLKIAYLYAKTVTLVPTHWSETNSVMARNRRIGLSQSGIIKAFGKHGRRAMMEWCDKGYEFISGLDIQYSNWLGVSKSIKKTSVKPSGTISLLPGEPPGIHYPHSEFYIRRIRVGVHSPLSSAAAAAGYHVEPAVGQEASTVVVSFPVKEEFFRRGKDDVSIWEQVANAVAYQKFWADNQVSVTVTFKPEEQDDIKHVLELYEDSLKGISFLPLSEHGYVQAPYEEITEEQYNDMTACLDARALVVEGVLDTVSPKFCDGDSCEI